MKALSEEGEGERCTHELFNGPWYTPHYAVVSYMIVIGEE
jgi:hypothetical protein